MFLLFKELVLPFILVSLLSAGVITTINIDFFFLENNLSERSLTELFQQLLLLASIAIFIWSSIKVEESRTLFVLVAGFFGCMFLRELDYYFDMIVHGFWLYPTLLLASLVITYSIKNNKHLISSVRSFSQTNAYFNILVGLVIIMIFSRLFGSGTLWKEVMNDDYHHIYKTIIQEGLELFGYVFVFIGSFHQLRNVKNNHQLESNYLPLTS
ncbi:hypothetical protein [Colwellia psychrerythraea]|uniref:Uncharacterized protein n=1 Tax=Colwellia psychrerythraea TaxID=28229 RepID=A0A099L3A0_COLPS|nr:hypothetical protein [Colwellia psychrerythraea]KGJ96920.1 hypothetical protein GAB14E_1388 [Colwellia psychrerythraea]